MTELVIAVLTTACCVFLASSLAKLRSRTAYLSFVMGLAETKLVPPRLLRTTAAALACSEVIVAIGTATAAAVSAISPASGSMADACALSLALALTSVLAVGIVVILRRGTQARCACFGAASERPLGRLHLTRNAALLTAVLTAIVVGQAGHPTVAAGGGAVAAVAGGLIGLLLVRLDDIVELFAPISAGRTR